MRFGVSSLGDYYPELGGTAFQRLEHLMSQITLADQLGFDAYWLAEHHFRPLGLVCSPAVVLAAAARQTRRIRLGPAVSVLPLRHPAQVAEEYALVDVLSNGRLNFGVGSGSSRAEFAGMGSPIETKSARRDEALTVITRLWQGERFSFSGDHFNLAEIHLPVPPLQQPRPPIWQAVMSAHAAEAAGRAGWPIMAFPLVSARRLADLTPLVDRWRQSFANAGGDAGAVALPMIVPTVVAATDAAARQIARPALDRLWRALHGDHASHQPAPGLAWLNSDLVAIGSAATVATAFAALAGVGATVALAWVDFGGLDPERSACTLRDLAREHLTEAEPTLV